MKSSGKTSYQLAGKLMQPGRKYWWRVDEIAGPTTIRGNLWTFKTREETAAEKDARFAHAKDFLDAKYGAFICWNMSALIGGQISWCRDAYGAEK